MPFRISSRVLYNVSATTLKAVRRKIVAFIPAWLWAA